MKCHICKKDFARADVLYKHVRKFHGTDAEKVAKAKRLEEKKAVAIPKQFQCRICKSFYKQRKDLYNHIRRHHDATTASALKEQYQVTKKAATDAKKSAENDEKKKKREETLKASTPSQHPCHICPASYKQKKDLYYHIRNKHDAESATAVKTQYETAKKEVAKERKRKREEEKKEERQAKIQAKRQAKPFNFARDIDRGEVCIKIFFIFVQKSHSKLL